MSAVPHAAPLDPDALAAFIEADIPYWAEFAEVSGIHPEQSPPVSP